MAVIVNGVPFTLFEEGLFNLLERPISPVGRYVTAKAELVAQQARQNAAANFNTRTGNLQRSIGTFPRETAEGLAYEIGTEGATYGRVLELGSPAHPIFPTNALVLDSYPGHPDPLDAPRSRVFHPGTAPKPWLRPALEAVFLGG